MPITVTSPGLTTVVIGSDTPAAASIGGVVTLEYWQAGGGGAGIIESGGGGGGGYGRLAQFEVADDDEISCVVPAGGAADTAGGPGNISFDSDPKLYDDTAAQMGESELGGPGGIVTGSPGYISYDGGSGDDAAGILAGGGGGSGAGQAAAGSTATGQAGATAPSGGGNGGAGGNVSANGANGANPGGGGGGGGDGATTGGTGGNGKIRISWVLKPAFTSSSTFSIQEGNTTVGQITVTNASAGFVISGAGADDDKFDIDGDELVFLTPPDYEIPGDENEDNVYVVRLRATNEGEFDGTDIETDQNVSVTVTNNAADDVTGRAGGLGSRNPQVSVIQGLTFYG